MGASVLTGIETARGEMTEANMNEVMRRHFVDESLLPSKDEQHAYTQCGDEDGNGNFDRYGFENDGFENGGFWDDGISDGDLP